MVIHLFGNKLRELRKEKKISQEEIGKLCDVAKTTISNWENNITQPPIEIITKLAQYFNVTTDYLLGFNQNDCSRIERLRTALKEAGVMVGDDLSVDELNRVMKIVEMLKEQKKGA